MTSTTTSNSYNGTSGLRRTQAIQASSDHSQTLSPQPTPHRSQNGESEDQDKIHRTPALSSNHHSNNNAHHQHGGHHHHQRNGQLHKSNCHQKAKPKKATKKTTTFVVSWMLSIALAFSLFQTFSYVPPEHKTDSEDHHHPGTLLAVGGGGATAAQNAKAFLERLSQHQGGQMKTPADLIAEHQRLLQMEQNQRAGGMLGMPMGVRKQIALPQQPGQPIRRGKKGPLANYDPNAPVGGFTRAEILAENQKLHPGERQPRTKIQQEQQEIFGKDYAKQAEILEELEPHKGNAHADLSLMNLEIKNKLLPLLGDGDELLSGRRRLVDVLKEANVYEDLGADQLKALPRLERNFNDMYGPPKSDPKHNHTTPFTHVGGKPIIYGLETCEAYRNMVPWRERFTAPAGMFNTGTNNLEMNLKRNLDYFGRAKYQVPWGKHRMESERGVNKAVAVGGLDHTKVLPVVIVRDPYFWMQSMCKTRYAARWAHGPRRCPNLVRTEQDKARFRQPIWDKSELKHPEEGTTTFQLRVRFDVGNVQFYDSMIDLWNEFYRPYWENKENYPRLIIRFEDMLLHAPLIVDQVAKCMGIESKPKFRYTTNTAKDHGSGTNFLEAVMKTASYQKREKNLVLKDKIYAAQYLDTEMMEAFHYRYVKG